MPLSGAAAGREVAPKCTQCSPKCAYHAYQHVPKHVPARTTAGGNGPAHPVPSLGIFLARFLLNDLGSVGIIPGITVFLATGLLVSLNMMGFSNVGAALITSIVVPLSLPLLALLVKLILLCHWWLQRFRRGPLEWLWRYLTYWRWEPMRRLSLIHI